MVLRVDMLSCVEVGLTFPSIQQQSDTLHVSVAGSLGITTGFRFSPTEYRNAQIYCSSTIVLPAP